MFCDWFVDNKLSILFGEDKTKSILFCSRHTMKYSKPLNIQYNDIKKNQYYKVICLGCILNETLSGESLVIHVVNKINFRLRFLCRQNRLLNFPLWRLLYSEIIQSFFDYASNAYYRTTNKKLKIRLQAAQNKRRRFCLKLSHRSSIKSKGFFKKWLPALETVSQCSLCKVYFFVLRVVLLR